MNIDDIKEIEIPKDCCLVTKIFEEQLRLREKYAPIEKKNGFPFPIPPFRIDDRFVQAHIKDLFWRATEEISEAMEDVLRNEYQLPRDWQRRWECDSEIYFPRNWDHASEIRHFFEELADALHFIVEASIVGQFSPLRALKSHWIWSGGQCITGEEPLWGHSPLIPLIPPKTIPTNELVEGCANLVFSMGLAANTLKNKPWKVSHMITDSTKFSNQMTEVWAFFGTLWFELGANLNFIYSLYMRKNAVNQFRQRSKY